VRPSALWTHPYIQSSNIEAFRHFINKRFSLDLRTFNDIHKWSVTEVRDFAHACWVFCGIKYSHAPTSPVIGAEKMWPPPKWFPNARLNFTENILSCGLGASLDAVAITALREGSLDPIDVTFRQLEKRVADWVSVLQGLGVGIGDRVASKYRHIGRAPLEGLTCIYEAVLTNSLDCITALLASAAIGAIFSSTAPDMGLEGILDRYKQLRPKVFICETEVVYAGKTIDLRPRFTEVNRRLREAVPELQSTIVVRGSTFEGVNVYVRPRSCY
jgi:acetoacetyl-CoA synthetase